MDGSKDHSRQKFDKSIGVRMKEIREAYGHSQEKAAENTDISSTFFRQIEKGQKGISAATLARFCKSYHVSADYVLFGVEQDHSWVFDTLSQFSKADIEIMESILLDLIKVLQPSKDAADK